MSSRGEIVPELAALLRKIADRIESKATNASDATALRRLARQAAGEDKRFKVKVHFGRGRAPLGARGVDRRLEMARAVKAYRSEHGCTLDETYLALSGKFGHASGPDTIKSAWREMRPLLDDEGRELILGFKRLEARGLAKVTRRKKGVT